MHSPLNVKLEGLHLQGYTVILNCLALNIKALQMYLPIDTVLHSSKIWTFNECDINTSEISQIQKENKS